MHIALLSIGTDKYDLEAFSGLTDFLVRLNQLRSKCLARPTLQRSEFNSNYATRKRVQDAGHLN